MHRDSVEIQNHLKTFGEFSLDRDQALSQTVIRIPLRTAAQAARSKLFQLKVDTREIRQALQEFCQEMKDGGLLFLKHIRKVIVRVNSDVMIDAEILEDLQGGAK